jgi:tetratricopeptide (TPR) repeat protein/tRNA A-37 threonylcarbamoyl transferase component Bud32
MDDRSKQIEQILAEVRRELDAGRSIDSTDLARRHPDLQPELANRLAELFGWPATIGPQAPGPGLDSTVAMVPEGSTVLAGPPQGETIGEVDPNTPTALAPPTPPPGEAQTLEDRQGSDAGARTINMEGGSTLEQVDALAETRLGPANGGHDPHLTRTSVDDGSPPAEWPAGPLEPGQNVRYIGDYELNLRIGVGGMGEVWRARQISLNRMVAVKMIKNASFASGEQIRRFQNEAEAVATLDHSGIVPIYEVGTFQDQRYFSMKLIDGQGMEKALPGLKGNPREAARIVAEVAEAVHHAHLRGILHRDLKPANILLDHEKHAHVTDFGLAKRIEAEEGMTLPGSVLGTPAYMSPEQASGLTSAITTATDVYGLGAVLFSALTDRAPFVGNTLYMTLERVRNQPPDAPHRLNPDVPRDLEVICLKCLAKEPRGRYGSALELAEDLRRWLNHEPIKARPVGPFVRLGMWARRKPALAGLSAALLVASIVGIIGIVWQWRVAVYERNQAEIAREDAVRQEGIARDSEGKARIARDQAIASEKAAQVSEKAAVSARAEAEQSAQQARVARDDAIRQEGIAREAEAKARIARDEAIASEKAAVAARAEAEKNAQLASMQAALALGTVQDLIERVNRGLERPNLFKLKTEIIQEALKRIVQVDDIYKGVYNKEATTLAALTELGKIYRKTGQIERAVELFQKCLGIARERLIVKKRNDGSRSNMANIYRELALCAEELDRDMNAVVANYQEAVKLFEEILARPTKDDPNLTANKVKGYLADTHHQLGAAYHHLGEISKALEEFRQSFNLKSELLDALKGDPKRMTPNEHAVLIRMTALSSLAMADCSQRLGRPKAAEGNFRDALDLCERFARLDPDDLPGYQLDLGNYHAQIGLFHFREGDLEKARQHLEESHRLFEGLARADERNAYQRREFFASTLRLAQLADVEKTPELARKHYEEAARLAEDMYRLDLKNDLRRIELMLVLPHVNQVDRALEYADKLAAGPKVDPELWTYLARTYAQCAKTLPPEKGEQIQRLQGKAVDAIEKAIALGFRDRAVLDLEHDLEPLRNRDDFKAALGKVPPPGG